LNLLLRIAAFIRRNFGVEGEELDVVDIGTMVSDLVELLAVLPVPNNDLPVNTRRS